MNARQFIMLNTYMMTILPLHKHYKPSRITDKLLQLMVSCFIYITILTNYSLWNILNCIYFLIGFVFFIGNENSGLKIEKDEGKIIWHIYML